MGMHQVGILDVRCGLPAQSTHKSWNVSREPWTPTKIWHDPAKSNSELLPVGGARVRGAVDGYAIQPRGLRSGWMARHHHIQRYTTGVQSRNKTIDEGPPWVVLIGRPRRRDKQNAQLTGC